MSDVQFTELSFNLSFPGKFKLENFKSKVRTTKFTLPFRFGKNGLTSLEKLRVAAEIKEKSGS